MQAIPTPPRVEHRSSADSSPAKTRLLEDCIRFIAAHGLADLSLRELAAGIGTSHRMLIYHFQSREGLTAAVVQAVEEDQRAALQALASEGLSPRDLILKQWEQLTDPTLRPFICLFFEILSLAIHRRPGTEGFLDSLTEPWIQAGRAVANSMELDTSRAELLLGIAVTRGLLIEVVATGDVGPATAAMHRFIEQWAEEPTGFS